MVCILPLERSVGVAQFILFYCATNFYMREVIDTVPAKIMIPKRPVSILELSLLVGVNKGTVYRWEHKGVVMDGKIVRLKTFRIGGSKRIDPSELQNFYDALNPDLEPRKITPRRETKLVQDAAEQARAWLNQ